jgi:DNA-binding PucR family transcriptional regulator
MTEADDRPRADDPVGAGKGTRRPRSATPPAGTLAQLTGWAAKSLPDLVERAYGSILDRMEIYRTDKYVPRQDLHRSVERNLRFVIAAIAEPDGHHDLDTPRQTGRRRAHQGAPLPEVLRAYRIGFATLWDALLEHARLQAAPRTTETLLDAAGVLWQLNDEHALALTEGYRAAMAELLRAEQRRRSALLEALLTGHPGADGGPWEAAKLLGIPPNADLIVVAAATAGLAEESMVGIEGRLAARGVVSVWRLTPTLQVGLIAAQHRQVDTALSVLREAVTARTGVSPVYRTLADTPRALHLARVALAALRQPELRVFSPSPLAALLASDPDEGRRLVQQIFGGLLDLPPDDRRALLDTLRAYLDHDGSAEQAGRVLHCHPNTVRYRLRRLHELTGRSLTDPRDIAELTAASYALQLNSDLVGPAGH